MIIGTTTRWMFRRGIMSLKEQIGILKYAKCSAAEISILKTGRGEVDVLSDDAEVDFGFVSMHLPKDEGLFKYSGLYRGFQERFGASAMVVHPDVVDDKGWEVLASLGIPVAVENMDNRKKSGFDIDELKDIMERHDFKFVLDSQHVYDHDPTMAYGLELLDAFRDRLSHIHVSGCTSDLLHAPLVRSSNRDEIIGFVRKVLSVKEVPVILEGFFEDGEELKAEMELLKF